MPTDELLLSFDVLLQGRLKTARAKRAADPDPNALTAGRVAQNLIEPPQIPAGSHGPAVTHPGWGAAQTALIGTGVGGALGLGRALFDKERRKQWLQSMLQGAAVGGGLGGAAGLVGYAGNYLAREKGVPAPVGEQPTGWTAPFQRLWNTMQNPTQAWEGGDGRPGGVPGIINSVFPRQDASGNPGSVIPTLIGGTAGGLTGAAGGRIVGGIADNALARRAERAADTRAQAAYNTPAAHDARMRQVIANPSPSIRASMPELFPRAVPGTPTPAREILGTTTPIAPGSHPVFTANPGLHPQLQSAANAAHPYTPRPPVAVVPGRTFTRLSTGIGGLVGTFAGMALPSGMSGPRATPAPGGN